jgi:hypothetical protein
MVSDYAGDLSQKALSGNQIVATNGHVHHQALAVIQLGDAAPRPGQEKYTVNSVQFSVKTRSSGHSETDNCQLSTDHSLL